MQDTMVIKQSLDKLFSENDTVFIVPHNRPDMDALGSAIGMSLICKKNKKKSYIIIDDDLDKIEAATRKVIEELGSEVTIINLSEAEELITDNSLMIAVDVNKTYLVSTEKILNRFKSILVIDHHKTDEHTIETKHLFIDEKLSSVCEEVSRLCFLYGVKFNEEYANYLLAGIILDTNKLSKNVSKDTFDVASKLVAKGADVNVANNMFLEDFEHDREVQRLVDNTIFPTYIYAIASDKETSDKIYEVEDIAKAADYLLKYQVNATFALAYIDKDTISISARSKGIIDVSKIMKLFGGGGNEHSAAAKVKNMNILDVKNKLNEILIPTCYLDSIDINNVDKEKKLVLKNNM